MSFTKFCSELIRNFLRCFSWKNLRWHLLAIVLTYLIVVSDFDWVYYKTFRNTILYPISFSAAIIGGLIPIFLPIILLVWGKIKKNAGMVTFSLLTGQAGILGWFISSLYKAFTGRDYPPHVLADDVSKVFHFGFWKAGIFWGWPSSHTTAAFAVSLAIIVYYAQNKSAKLWAWIYAFFIGIGVSISIHWFSDFLAGAIIGSVIGVVVGKSFQALKTN